MGPKKKQTKATGRFKKTQLSAQIEKRNKNKFMKAKARQQASVKERATNRAAAAASGAPAARPLNSDIHCNVNTYFFPYF